MKNMIPLDISQMATPDAYKILIGSVVPRPIAWVSTVDGEGRTNLAPFSFFTAVCSHPPTVLFCPVTPADQKTKDTLHNIRTMKEFVVNIVTEDNVHAMNQTSANYAPDVSEFDAVGLTPLPSVKVRPPRVAESPIHLECVLNQIVNIGGDAAGSGHIVIGQIVQAHVDNDAYDAADGSIDTSKIKPVSRLSGTNYAPVHDIFTIARPDVV